MKPGWILSRCSYLAGHASPVTTAKYDRRGEEALATGGAAFTVLEEGALSYPVEVYSER
jgi:hypothetical protein